MFFGYISQLVCHFNVIFSMVSSNNKRKLPANNENLDGDPLIKRISTIKLSLTKDQIFENSSGTYQLCYLILKVNLWQYANTKNKMNYHL